MKRYLSDERDRSKMRPVSLSDNDVDFIRKIGDGSLTGGIRQMMKAAKLILEIDNDFTLARAKLTNAIDRNLGKRNGMENTKASK